MANRAGNKAGQQIRQGAEGREQKAKQYIKQRKGIGVALREREGLICGMPVKVLPPLLYGRVHMSKNMQFQPFLANCVGLG